MKITVTTSFRRATKCLNSHDKKELDNQVKVIAKDPSAGSEKKGDLAGVYTVSFKMHGGQFRVAYTFNDDEVVLIAFGARESFYDRLKK